MNGIQTKERFKVELHWEKERHQKREWKCLELNLLCPVLPYNKRKNLFASQLPAEEMARDITCD